MKTALYNFQSGKLSLQPKSDQLNNQQVQLVLCFGDKQAIAEADADKILRQQFPNAVITTCSAAGAIANTDVEDNGFIATAIEFEKTTVHSHSVNINDFANSYQAGFSLMQQINIPDTQFIFLLSDGQKVNGSELIRGINEANTTNIPVSGGLAADGYHFVSTLTGINGKPGEGNIIAIALSGKHLVVNHGTEAGWENFGPERVVTKATNNRLFEIDGKNALELYKKYLGKEADALPGSALFFPLSLKLSEEADPLVRTILSVDNTNDSMVFAGDVPEGSKVRFMRANLDRLTNAATNAAVQTLNGKKQIPKLAILVSCVGRKLVLNERTDEELTAVDEVFGGKTILSGFYSYGEIAPCLSKDSSQLHNQTMSITTFYEIEQAAQ
ncbi:MAG: FIST C-terminal domain-containing protein [Chitinophagaceae bacterium]